MSAQQIFSNYEKGCERANDAPPPYQTYISDQNILIEKFEPYADDTAFERKHPFGFFFVLGFIMMARL